MSAQFTPNGNNLYHLNGDVGIGTNSPNPDWQQGEMQAVNSIHITNGFHASASDELHLHTGAYINNLIREEWTEDDYKNKANKNKNTTTSNNIKNELSTLQTFN